MADTAHPSGLPGAPWNVGPAHYRVADAAGELVALTAPARGEQLAAAVAILPELIAEAMRLIAADRAFEESAPDTEDERAALRVWDETSIDAVWKMEALLTRAGITVPSLPEPPASLPAGYTLAPAEADHG